MADRDSVEQPETAASTPSSQHASQNGPKATKDRSCPFCGQAFTSSSLGRHLDLYIKPKNPKPPDGVHHVAEIRKMRGGITRRQPKTSLKDSANVNASGWKRDSADGTPNAASSSKSVPRVDTKYTDHSPVASPVNMRDGDQMHTTFNAPNNWQATGVINNLPPRAPSRSNADKPTGQAQRIQNMRRDGTGNTIQRPEYDAREHESLQKLHEDAEVGRVAELALRELLGSLEAAKKRVEPKQLFEHVDFFTLAFPGLCLAILPAPTTLFSPTPFPGNESWTLSPPGQKQFETLNGIINKHVAAIRQSGYERFPDSAVFKHSAHVQGSYEHWQHLSEHERASAWTLETLRAYQSMHDQKQQAQRELEAAQNRVRHLEAEYDRMSRFQLPREYLLRPPNTMPAPAAIVKEMQNTQLRSGAAEVDYDADVLLGRWRAAVKATSRRPPPPPPPPPAQVPSTHLNYDFHERSGPMQLRSDMVMNGAIFNVNGVMPRNDLSRPNAPAYTDYETPPNPGVVVGAEEDETEDADADGEADEDDSGNFGSYVDRGVLVKKQPFVADAGQDAHVNGTLNANGKRPLAPTQVNRRAGGPKMYREQPPCRGRDG